MAQVILIENSKTLNDLISVNLTTYLGVDLIQRKNAQEAISLLDILPSIDLIIANEKIIDEPTSDILSDYITIHKLETGLIILGTDKKVRNDFSIHISNPKDWEQVIHASAKVLGINENVLAKKAIPDYVAVPVKYFLNIEEVNCDVFIRIKKSPTEYQFLKRIHKDDTFSRDSIKRYMEQGLEHFYISKDSHKNFSTYLSNKLVNKIDAPDMDTTHKIQIMGESFDIAIDEILKFGFNSETIQLTESIIQNMIKNFEKTPEMSNLLHKVINSETGLLWKRCHMTSIVANEIVKNLKFQDQKSYEKIAYAAFFHDILLSDKEDLTKINSSNELEMAKLEETVWGKVFSHASDAADLVKKNPEIPTGTDEIIRHHHGALNGKGFSNTLDRLSDLSKIFIIAHHFVLELVRFKDVGGTPRPVTEELYRRYPTPDMALIIKALERTLQKKKK